jgi:acetyl esterase/lipase
VETPLLTVDEILSLPNPEPDHRIRYGDDPLQFGDLRLPDGEPPYPVAIVIHGGCWRSRYDVSHIGSFSAALTGAGIATWTLEYRRVGNPGGGWPGTFLDIARGADFVRELAPRHALSPDRIVAAGHSAGGHLALWLAARPKLGRGSPIRGASDPILLSGVVSLAGVDDLERALRENVCDDMAAQLLGGRPEEVRARYREASPIELLPLGVRQHVISGARDSIVPAGFARDFAARSRALGDDVTLDVLEDAGHFELIAPASPAFPAVRNAVAKLLGR